MPLKTKNKKQNQIKPKQCQFSELLINSLNIFHPDLSQLFFYKDGLSIK